MKIISKQLGNKDMIRGGPETKRSKFQISLKLPKLHQSQICASTYENGRWNANDSREGSKLQKQCKLPNFVNFASALDPG